MGPELHCALLAYINILNKLLLIFFRDKAKIALFSKLSNFYFHLRPLGQTPGQDRGAKTRPQGATKMCESPGVAQRGGWLGLELTYALYLQTIRPAEKKLEI